MWKFGCPSNSVLRPTRVLLFVVGLSAALAVSTIQQGIAQAQIVSANSGGMGAVWSTASFPVENFQTYTSPFGYRLSPDGTGGEEFHSGLDLAAPQGSYIRNWWGGQIIEVSDDSNCGTSVVMQSGGWTHIYCHMMGHVEVIGGFRYLIDRDGGIQLREGLTIPTGARIGRVGMTGRTTGPHLHWGLKYDSQWVDPAQVLRAMYSAHQQVSQR
jgi:murein DD-endopeptidase MepM/ murein hydrolase activator NlpD